MMIDGKTLTRNGNPVSAVRTHFAQDNFSIRRTTGHNMFDPDSLITGAELAQGFTYANSHRKFDTQSLYDAAVSGDIPAHLLPRFAPRVLNHEPFWPARESSRVQAYTIN